jgi:hypothetical protein
VWKALPLLAAADRKRLRWWRQSLAVKAMRPFAAAAPASQRHWRCSALELEQGTDNSRPKVSPPKLQEQGRNAVVAFDLN